jgi:glycerophosphoryl diester phosphodiesterase
VADPLFIERAGHRTWLKWHRGRRRATDPVFTGARILEGMRLGASVEVDLVIHADGGCAILHDLTLDRETTGTGRVRATDAATLRSLQLRDNDGRSIAEPVMLLEDLCQLLAQEQPHPDARLQLDFKEDRAALTPDVVSSFARAVTPVASSMILSGGAADAITLLANATPALPTGYDPCYGASLARLKETGDFHTFIGNALEAAPDAQIIYLNYEIILAANDLGINIVAPVHAAGRQVDAWTIRTVDTITLPQVEQLLALKVDQITTDDPEGLYRALTA